MYVFVSVLVLIIHLEKSIYVDVPAQMYTAYLDTLIFGIPVPRFVGPMSWAQISQPFSATVMLVVPNRAWVLHDPTLANLNNHTV